MGTVYCDNTGETKVNSGRHQRRCNGQANKIHEEHVVVEWRAVEYDPANITKYLENLDVLAVVSLCGRNCCTHQSKEHSNHIPPSLMLDPEEQLADDEYTEDGGIESIARKGW